MNAGVGCANRSVGRAAAVMVAVLWVLAGCGEDPPTGVRLVVTTDLAVPDELDGLEVTIVASPTADAGALCRPVALTIPADGAGSFPFELLVDKGTEYVGWIAFRVDGLRGGALVQRREVRLGWPADGVRDVEVPLQAACVELVTPCEQECIDGHCVDWASPEGIFDDGSLVGAGAPDCFEER